jgi:hypothetical protein
MPARSGNENRQTGIAAALAALVRHRQEAPVDQDQQRLPVAVDGPSFEDARSRHGLGRGRERAPQPLVLQAQLAKEEVGARLVGQGAARQERSKPIVEALHAWLTAQLGRVSGRSALAEAIRYALRHWPGLVRFLEDGRIELDNNTVERALRPIALGRKNALFAGSDGGARH